MSSSIRERLQQLASQPIEVPKDPQTLLRVVLALLAIANLAAALMLFQPWGATPEELEQNLIALRAQQKQSQAELERLGKIVEKVERAREEGDGFMREYFMDRRTASSTIVSELKQAAATAGLKQEVHTFQEDAIEGSDNLGMMTISGNYEGAYENLMRFIHLLDRSPRFLILDTLTASPERTAGTLNVNFNLNAFVIHDQPREDSKQQADEEGASGEDQDEATEPEPDKPSATAGKENLAG